MYRYFMIFHDISCKKRGRNTGWNHWTDWFDWSTVEMRHCEAICPKFTAAAAEHVHIYWSAAAWFISSVETWGSLQFSGYWKRSMAIKIGYPPIIETTPVFTDMFLSNYNIIYLCKDFQQMTLIMHTLHTVYYMCI